MVSRYLTIFGCILAMAHSFSPVTKAAFHSTTSISMSTTTEQIKVGDTLPDVSMMEGQPDYGNRSGGVKRSLGYRRKAVKIGRAHV